MSSPSSFQNDSRSHRSASRIRILTAGGFLSFFVFGFADNLKGAILPELLESLSLTDTQGGTIQLGAYLGFIVTCFFTGILADLIGNRFVLILAGLFLTIGLAGFSIGTLFWLLFGFMFIFGIGTGAIEVGGNDLIVELHGDNRGRYLNLLGVFHGIGSLLVPLYVAGALSFGFSWRSIVQSTLVLSVLLLLYFLLARRHDESKENATGVEESDAKGAAAGEYIDGETDTGGSGGINWPVLRRQGFTPEMRWFYLLLGAYVSIELGLAAWMVEYLQRIHGVSETTSQFYLSGLFVAIMFGRLLGSVIVDRVGYLRAIGIALVGSLTCLLSGLNLENGLLFLPATGLFLSIVFPTVAAAVSERNPENAGSILGLLFTFGGLGGAAGPWLIGMVSDWRGLQAGLSCTIGFTLLALVALAVLMQKREVTA